ncbi:Mediator of RNA polymerase II transcription subunit 4 [Dirofilaria immitis]|nr:Mediator of RNA polymerase II transcription subunit 4 [Dirofilaria immitis]
MVWGSTMADRCSLKECLQENTEDLEATIKMIIAFVLDRDRSCGSLTSLCESFRKKHAELTRLLAKVPAYQQREREIRRLEAEVEARDKVLGDLQKQLMAAEKLITKMVFQEMRQSEANRVNSETIIRFANQISRTYAVAAPLGWQLGDTSLILCEISASNCKVWNQKVEFKAELRLSALAAPRVIVQAAPPALSLLRQPTATASGMLRGSGRGASPITSYSAAMQQQRSWSPRGTFVQQSSSSPRGRNAAGRNSIISPRMNAAPGANLLQRRPSITGSSSHLSSPSSSYQGPIRGGLPPPITNVEQMSSDSSSSSSSDEGSPQLHDFLDLTDFVNQRIEEDLDELFVSRYTMANELYAEVANGFPDPVTVYPWSKRPKRNFDYTGDHRKPWRGDSRRNVSSEWRSNRGNPSYDPYVQELRKRRNPTMDIIKKQHTTNP